MATIAEYLAQLQADKEALINSLSDKGVEVATDATFTSLVPKVDEVEEMHQAEITNINDKLNTLTTPEVTETPTNDDFLTNLEADKQALVDNLNEKGVEASTDETFTSLIPKISEIESGGSSYKIKDGTNLFYQGKRLSEKDGIATICELTDCTTMFSGCQVSSLDVSMFDMSKVTTMYSIFNNCRGVTSLDLSTWKTDSLTNMKAMFGSNPTLKTVIFGENFDTSKVTTMDSLFQSCEVLTSVNIDKFVTDNVTSFYGMFDKCKALTSLDLKHFNTSKATYLALMFNNCNALTSLDVSGWDTSKNTSMWYMFYYCSALPSLNIKHFNTSNVTTMSYAFTRCSSLTELDLGGWDTSKVTDMSYIFQICSGLTSLKLDGWNTEKVTTLQQSFAQCSKLTELDLSHFNTSNVTNLNQTFSACSGLTKLNLSGWDTSKVTNYAGTFMSCKNLQELDIRNFDFTKASSYSNVFNGVPVDCLIIVKDDTAKDWVLARRSDLTNVKTVAELA